MSTIPSEPLAERTRQYLLESLYKGRWMDGLPAERQLAEDLGVSRPVLRLALQKLENQGYLARGVRGKRVPSSKVERQLQSISAVVVHSSVESSIPASTATMLRLTALRLTERNIKMSGVYCPDLKTSEVSAALSKLHNDYPYEIWILRSPSAAALVWCELHHPRCVVLGSQPEPAPFPGVDLDIDSVFDHSLKLCVEQQRREVIFLVPPGESHAATRLEIYLASHESPEMRTSIERLPNRDKVQGKRLLLHLLSAHPRPNAFICTNFQQWMLIYSLLMEANISPLKDVFLLCHYPDPLMDWVSHGVAHYAFDWAKAAVYLADCVQDDSINEVLSLMPMFVPAH